MHSAVHVVQRGECKKKWNEHSSQTQKLRVNGCVVCCQCDVRIGGLKNMPWQMEWRGMGTVVQSASLGMLQFSLFTKWLTRSHTQCIDTQIRNRNQSFLFIAYKNIMQFFTCMHYMCNVHVACISRDGCMHHLVVCYCCCLLYIGDDDGGGGGGAVATALFF